MQKRQIDNYDMFLAVENHFDDNPLVWSASLPIANTKILLSSKINLLAIQVALQLVNPTGITEKKDKVRSELESQAFVLSASMSGYASVEENLELYKRCFYNKTDLVRFRDAELLGICTNLAADCAFELVNLMSYGITDVELDKFNTIIAAFGTIMKNPTEAIARRKVATENIESMIPDIAAILNTRMDNLLVMLTEADPSFVATYSNLRAINKTGSNVMSLTTTMLDAGTNEPVVNVNIEVLGQNIKRTSSSRGYNTVLNLIAGSHEIKAMHPNYETVTKIFTIVSGETTELLLLLNRI
jgi:hypothetical protein